MRLPRKDGERKLTRDLACYLTDFEYFLLNNEEWLKDFKKRNMNS
jgi:hypothetical protein